MLSPQSKEALRVLGVDEIAKRRFVEPDIKGFFWTVENEPGLLIAFSDGSITGKQARSVAQGFDIRFALVWRIAGRMVGIC